MTLSSTLTAINRHNVQTLRTSPLAEISGALGDLGTLLPLMIAMTLTGSINLGSTLVFSGLANIMTGMFFGIPLPVQPMKAIAAVAISQKFSKGETAAAGLTMGFAVLFLSATSLLRWLHRVVPVAVVKGIQGGAGLSLVISAGTSLITPLKWASPALDNRIWAVAAFVFLLIASLVPRIPYALIVFVCGVVIAAATVPYSSTHGSFSAGIWHPSPLVPSGAEWRTGAIDAAIPQLPLTTLNSILAVTSLSAGLFPSFPPAPSTTAVGFSVALANLIACWFGAMPVCHGSGGLAGQYRFGARSGASVILLGAVKLLLGLFVGEAVIPLLQRFPHGLLGIMVLAAGVELAKVGQGVGEARDLWEQAGEQEGAGGGRSHKATEQESSERWMVMLITAAGCVAFKNDAVGFLAGLVWHWGLRLPGTIERVRRERTSIRLESQDEDELLGANHDEPDGEAHQGR